MGQDKFNLDVFREIIEKGKKIYNINVFVLDHLHFLARKSSIGNTTEEIGYMMREIVAIARKYNVTIFVISHIRKKQGQGGWKEMPNMNELRDSGLIKGDAHMVIMLFKTIEENKPIMQLSVQKNREGNITAKHLLFDFDVETGKIKQNIKGADELP